MTTPPLSRSSTRLPSLALAAAALFAAGPTVASTTVIGASGSVRGKVTITRKGKPANDHANVVVYLEDVPGAPPTGLKTEHEIRQIDKKFLPAINVVMKGTQVAFPNEDDFFHNVFSYSKAKRFDLGRYGKGGSKGVRFDEPGLIKIFCDIHSNMSAFIYVVDTPLVVQPDEGGRYALAGIRPGTYSLTLWHPERGEREMNVVIVDGDNRLDLQF